jgi:hypothetical protein
MNTAGSSAPRNSSAPNLGDDLSGGNALAGLVPTPAAFAVADVRDQHAPLLQILLREACESVVVFDEEGSDRGSHGGSLAHDQTGRAQLQ